jgi:anaerobic magnesium-protoporphyrin IX monomethyl ester cyclase
MKVLLVNAPQIKHHRKRTATRDTLLRSPPLHLGYLAAVMEQHGHETKLLDLNVVNDETETFEQKLKSFNPDLVGLSSTTASFTQAVRLARVSKETLPHSPVILGGCHVTFTATQTLKENPAVNIVVRGEGEQTLQELVDRIEAGQPPKGVLGLSYRQDGLIVHNPPRPFIQDLDTLPWPARHLIDMTQYNAPGALSSSRGCPGRCIFCAAGTMSGHRYRHRKPARVVDEMEHLCYERGLQWLVVIDDTFTASPRRFTLPVCAEIQRRGLKATFGCESRVDVATPQLIETLRKAGCDFIQFGVESGSPRVLAALKKRITLDQVRQAARYAVELGIEVACSFVLGHPDETQEDAYMTLDLVEELLGIGVHRVVISPLIPYPGTDVYEQRQVHGVTIHTDDWNQFSFGTPIISTRHLSRERLRELYVEANVRIVRNSKSIAESQKERL